MQELDLLDEEKDLDKSLKDLPKNLQGVIDILDAKEQNDQDLKNHLDLMNEFKYPASKIEFADESLKGVEANEQIKESLGILDEIDSVDKQMDELKQKQEREKEELEKEFSTKEQEPSKEENSQENLDKTIDEKYQEALLNMQKNHEEELLKLQGKKDELLDKYEKSINNLVNSKDLAELLQGLREMDRALALLIRENHNEYDLRSRQREEKLEMALNSQTTKEVVREFMSELHGKKNELKHKNEELKKESIAYYELDKDMKKLENKEDLSLEDGQNLQKKLEKIDKDLPNFKQNYPKIYEKADKFVKNIHQNIKQKVKEKTQEKGRSL